MRVVFHFSSSLACLRRQGILLVMFKNKNINLLNLHTGLQRFSNSIFDVFGAIYLLQLGISFPVVALVWAASFVLRMFLRPLSLLMAQKIGLKRATIFGTIIGAGLFLVLAQVNGLTIWLYIFIVFLALYDITYWLPYHSYYAAVGNYKDRGKHVGVRGAFVTLFRAAAPIVGAVLISKFGFWSLYLVAMISMLVSVIPILFASDYRQDTSMNFKRALRSIDKRGFLIQIGDGIVYNAHGFMWIIVLFFLTKNIISFGWLIGFEVLLTAVLFLVLGDMIDKGKGRKILSIGIILFSLVILGRTFFVYTINAVIISQIAFAVAVVFYRSIFQTSFYNLAKKTKNTLWFNFFGEMGWDIGALIILVLSAVLVSLGLEIRYIMPFAIVGLFVIQKVLSSYLNNSYSLSRRED